jgi:hypothetical protein
MHKQPLLEIDQATRVLLSEIYGFLTQTWGSHEFIRYFPASDEVFIAKNKIRANQIKSRQNSIQKFLKNIHERLQIPAEQSSRVLEISESLLVSFCKAGETIHQGLTCSLPCLDQ